MSDSRKRILFLCANRSIRSLMAASLLAAKGQERWDIWSTPLSDEIPQDSLPLAHHVLDEIGIPLLASPQTTEPEFGLSWHTGIVLCSGAADF